LPRQNGWLLAGVGLEHPTVHPVKKARPHPFHRWQLRHERERPAVPGAGAELEPRQALLPREPAHLGVLGLALGRVEEGEERDSRGVDAQALERLGRAGGPRGVGQRREELRERDEAP
jgi:hypothetical protein